ncbi:MAG: 1-deoxy-D-xylulose-5-phosphate reductoisomerase [Clostridia bacterium]|nr:1-deoxy-D-xylulose-5-phosphate reductoisomerase [Clostridia bacterium]
MKKIALIGSTGSIGVQVLNAVRRHPNTFKIVALVANGKTKAFMRQVKEFNPVMYATAADNKEAALRCAECEDADIVFNAAPGFVGLEYSLRAVRAKKTLALANKETLVCGGEFFMRIAEQNGAEIIPVDSEHSAIFQCLGFNRKTPFKKLIITASGGAFRGYTEEQLKSVTPAQALKHPTWKMGKKITIDSATMMNKAYEIIEAHELYNAPYSKLDAVIQPSSIVHSMVEFTDGAVLAQLGEPDMEVPIQLALTYPKRMTTEAKHLSFKQLFSLEFIPLNKKDYPLFSLAIDCGKEGGTLPCALNAADEIAVKAFLDGKIAFTDIYTTVAQVMSTTSRFEIVSYKQLADVDRNARWKAQKIIYKLSK